MQPMIVSGLRASALMTLAAALGACANNAGQGGQANSSSSQTINVSTIPEGARCELRRDGKIISTVEKTPEAVTIDRARRPLLVQCAHPGHVDGFEMAEPKFHAPPGQTAYVPNTAAGLAGGLIGLLIVSALETSSSRNYSYQAFITVALPVNSFSTVEERDAKYAEFANVLKERSAKAQKAAASNCHPDDRTCEVRAPEKNAELEQALQRLEQLKQAAIIEPAAPAAPGVNKAAAN